MRRSHRERLQARPEPRRSARIGLRSLEADSQFEDSAWLVASAFRWKNSHCDITAGRAGIGGASDAVEESQQGVRAWRRNLLAAYTSTSASKPAETPESRLRQWRPRQPVCVPRRGHPAGPAARTRRHLRSHAHEVVEAMLKMANVTGSDVVYDLGCGDGGFRSPRRRSTARARWASTSIPSASRKRPRTSPRPTSATRSSS